MQKHSAVWFKNNPSSKDKEALQFLLDNPSALVERLKELLEEFRKEEERADLTLKDFENPNWAYLQANRNGAKRALAKVEALFKPVET